MLCGLCCLRCCMRRICGVYNTLDDYEGTGGREVAGRSGRGLWIRLNDGRRLLRGVVMSAAGG